MSSVLFWRQSYKILAVIFKILARIHKILAKIFFRLLSFASSTPLPEIIKKSKIYVHCAHINKIMCNFARFYFFRCFKQDERNYKNPSIG